jgi:hypothetical protein
MGEPGAFLEITEGPLVGTGLVSFLTREQVNEVYGVFPKLLVERASYTSEGGTKLIEHWVVVGFKNQ